MAGGAALFRPTELTRRGCQRCVERHGVTTLGGLIGLEAEGAGLTIDMHRYPLGGEQLPRGCRQLTDRREPVALGVPQRLGIGAEGDTASR